MGRQVDWQICRQVPAGRLGWPHPASGSLGGMIVLSSHSVIIIIMPWIPWTDTLARAGSRCARAGPRRGPAGMDRGWTGDRTVDDPRSAAQVVPTRHPEEPSVPGAITGLRVRVHRKRYFSTDRPQGATIAASAGQARDNPNRRD